MYKMKLTKKIISLITLIFFVLMIIIELMILYMILFINPMTYQMYCEARGCNRWVISQVIWIVGALFFGWILHLMFKGMKK